MTEEDETNEEKKIVKDRFGLKKMSTNQEVAVSFTLFTLGVLFSIVRSLSCFPVYEYRTCVCWNDNDWYRIPVRY